MTSSSKTSHWMKLHRMKLHRMKSCSIALLCLALAACGGSDSPKPARILDTPQEAISRSGDVTIRANLVRTLALNDAMARTHGIERDDHTALLMVSVRKGPESSEVSLPAKINATVTDLQGKRVDIDMREVRTGEFIDHLGTITISVPDTLRFDLTIQRDDGTVSTMQFTREFLP